MAATSDSSPLRRGMAYHLGVLAFLKDALQAAREDAAERQREAELFGKPADPDHAAASDVSGERRQVYRLDVLTSLKETLRSAKDEALQREAEPFGAEPDSTGPREISPVWIPVLFVLAVVVGWSIDLIRRGYAVRRWWQQERASFKRQAPPEREQPADRHWRAQWDREAARLRLEELRREWERRREDQQERHAERARERRRAEQERERQRAERLGSPGAQAWWTVLEVAPDASLREITDSYRRKIQRYHPDRVSGLAPEFIEVAERHSKALNAAFAEAKRAKAAG